jgi:hypothetical protein
MAERGRGRFIFDRLGRLDVVCRRIIRCWPRKSWLILILALAIYFLAGFAAGYMTIDFYDD